MASRFNFSKPIPPDEVRNYYRQDISHRQHFHKAPGKNYILLLNKLKYELKRGCFNFFC